MEKQTFGTNARGFVLELMSMKAGFTAHGPLNYMNAKESALWESIRKKYAGELASAPFLKKLKIKLRMQRELFFGGHEGHRPSAGTLW